MSIDTSGLQDRAIEYDTKCPDGFTCYGWRRINKGGYVRFSHGRHYHEELAKHVGKYIYVTLDDCYGINVDVWPAGPWKQPVLRPLNESEWAADQNEQGGGR